MYLLARAGNMLKTLNIQTQAIMKKVALNPQVFWCFPYVSSVRDSGMLMFSGDMGGHVSWFAFLMIHEKPERVYLLWYILMMGVVS